MAPHTWNQANHTDNENTIHNKDGIAGNANVNPTQNLEALTLLPAQLVVLLAKGANAKQGGKQDVGERRGCTFEQFNKQHPQPLRDCQMQWLRRIGSYKWRSSWTCAAQMTILSATPPLS
ncbi:hypothetical protein SLA2020_380730 [Shorea laevis]